MADDALPGSDGTIEHPERIPEVLSNLPSSETTAIVAAFVSGPIPLPSLLKGYEEVAPGSAKRILDNAFGQTKHRQALELQRVTGDERRADRGQFIGAAAVFMCLVCAAVLGLYDKQWIAIAFLSSAVSAILAAFVTAYSGRKSELEAKSKLKAALGRTDMDAAQGRSRAQDPLKRTPG